MVRPPRRSDILPRLHMTAVRWPISRSQNGWLRDFMQLIQSRLLALNIWSSMDSPPAAAPPPPPAPRAPPPPAPRPPPPLAPPDPGWASIHGVEGVFVYTGPPAGWPTNRGIWLTGSPCASATT